MLLFVFVFVFVKLSMHNKTRNRGLAFVTMGSPDEALAALNNLEAFVRKLQYETILFSNHGVFVFTSEV